MLYMLGDTGSIDAPNCNFWESAIDPRHGQSRGKTLASDKLGWGVHGLGGDYRRWQATCFYKIFLRAQPCM